MLQLLLHVGIVVGFAPPSHVHVPLRSSARSASVRLSDAAADDRPTDDTDQVGLFASLRARTLELETAVANRWKSAKCASKVVLAMEDWVRRLDVDWPLAIVGASQGGLYLADVHPRARPTPFFFRRQLSLPRRVPWHTAQQR